MSNFLVAGLDLGLLKPNGFSELSNETVLLSILFFETFDLAFKLLHLQIIYFSGIFQLLNKIKITEPAFLDYLSS